VPDQVEPVIAVAAANTLLELLAEPNFELADILNHEFRGLHRLGRLKNYEATQRIRQSVTEGVARVRLQVSGYRADCNGFVAVPAVPGPQKCIPFNCSVVGLRVQGIQIC
jgi:hypothetical protein